MRSLNITIKIKAAVFLALVMLLTSVVSDMGLAGLLNAFRGTAKAGWAMAESSDYTDSVSHNGAKGGSSKGLAVLRVTTDGGEEPTCRYVDAPAGCWGASKTDNAYVSCNVRFYDFGNHLLVNDAAKIKIRGNTSAYGKKKPYKLKMNHKQDFGSGASVKKWILLKWGTDLKFLFANWVSSYCGMEWQPSFQYVNLYLNDDYKGCYILAESVENMEKHLDMDADGFLIENDAYWWNSDLYFKANGQIDPMGFTFKVPDSDDIIDNTEYVDGIRSYINEAVESIRETNCNRYLDYIDAESFAAWFLINDYFCNHDAAGANMFWYRINGEGKIKLGPAWDYNNNYSGDKQDWSRIHREDINFGSDLFKKESFKETYRNLFNEKKDICEKLEQYVNGYLDIFGESLQESWEKDAQRWNTDPGNVQQEKDTFLNWYKERRKWIDAASSSWISGE